MTQINTLPIATIVTMLIEHEGKYLLVQEAKEKRRNLWSLPGGDVEADEPILEAALREIKEETGYDVAITGMLYFDQLRSFARDQRMNRYRFVFIGEIRDGSQKQQEDMHSIQSNWFSAAEIKELNPRDEFIDQMIGLRLRNTAMLPIDSFRECSWES
jgi:ADP-ribose pyrophosphatase YjhB (NUDIX family)